jgi:hypothetical protein
VIVTVPAPLDATLAAATERLDPAVWDHALSVGLALEASLLSDVGFVFESSDQGCGFPRRVSDDVCMDRQRRAVARPASTRPRDRAPRTEVDWQVSDVGRAAVPFPLDVALLQLAVTALNLGCPAGTEPLEYGGLRERYLPEVTFRGRFEHRNSRYAVYAACMPGGLQPDLSDAQWWQTRCGRTPSSPSSSTAVPRPSALRSRRRKSLGGSALGTASSWRRDQL